MSQLLEEKVIELKLDRSAWRLIKFGDVAIQQKGSVDRDNTDLSKYIKGEHMSSEDLHLREWGELTDEYLGPAFIRKFEEGDILYGSRRTYLRKVAIARFSGITSNTTFVIKANEAKIDKRLLPFLMLSEGFAEHSIRNSKGSVNPYVNWKDLADYEFLLPPKDQQAKLAELLWAMDEVVEKHQCVFLKTKDVFSSVVKCKCLNVSDSEIVLSDIIDNLEAGISVNSIEGKLGLSDKGILKTSAVSEGIFNPNEVKKVAPNEVSRLKTVVRKNSILISRMNTVELVGANVYIKENFQNLYLPDRLWQTCISREDVNTKYLWFILSSPQYRKKISVLCTVTSNSMKNISKQSFLGLKVKLPSKTIQDNAIKDIELIEYCLQDSEKKLNASKELQKSLINQIF